MPAILDTWEEDIGRSKVQGQSKQKVIETISTNKEWGMLACSFYPSYSGSTNRRIMAGLSINRD
jgi:hypothetical protein